MTTDEEPRSAETTESEQHAHESSARTRAELDAIEATPLADRATGYQQLAERLRTELEHSDPSRGLS